MTGNRLEPCSVKPFRSRKQVRQPRVDDKAWHVDWCASIPEDPDTREPDLDNADYRTETWWSKPKAERRAKAVLELDVFGLVTLTPVEFVPYDESDADKYPTVGYWEPVGDSECIEKGAG